MLKDWIGRKWVHVLGPLIESIKLRAFYRAEKSRSSLRSARLFEGESSPSRKFRHAHGDFRLSHMMVSFRSAAGSL